MVIYLFQSTILNSVLSELLLSDMINMVMRVKKQEISEKTKESLKRAFWHLYTKKELDKITVKELCDIAGYNRGTFYLYYKDIYDIFNCIENELLNATAKILNTATENTELDFSKHMSMIMEMAQKYSAYVSVLLSRQSNNQFSSKLKEMIIPLLEPYLIRQECNKQEKEIIIEFYMSGLLAAIAKWLQTEDAMPINDFIDFVLKRILYVDERNAYVL